MEPGYFCGKTFESIGIKGLEQPSFSYQNILKSNSI